MKSATKGNAGEAMVLAALVDRGFDVLVPFGSGQPYDLVLAIDNATFVRIQCKTAWQQKGCLLFNCRSTDHGRGQRSYLGLADVFGVYFPPTQSVYLVPVDVISGFAGRLRVEPPRNNQRRKVRLAADFAIDLWTAKALTEIVSRTGSVEASRLTEVA